MKEFYGSSPIYEVFDNAKFRLLKTDIWRYCLSTGRLVFLHQQVDPLLLDGLI